MTRYLVYIDSPEYQRRLLKAAEAEDCHSMSGFSVVFSTQSAHGLLSELERKFEAEGGRGRKPLRAFVVPLEGVAVSDAFRAVEDCF